MDVPVKKLVRLLHPDQPADLRSAAVLVFAELGVKDADAGAELIARLDDDDPAVRVNAIRAAGKLKLAKALPVLLDRIRGGGEEANLAADAAAKLGAEAVRKLQDLMHHVVPGLRRYIAAALTTVSAAGAEAGVSVLLDPDRQIAAAAANAIIGRIPTMPADRKAELVAELLSLATDKKNKLPITAELPVVRVLASLNDPSAAEALWDRTLPPYPHEVRAAALSTVGGWVTAPTKEQWRRLFACAAEPNFAVAAPALVLLGKLPTSDKQAADWLTLMAAPDAAARRLAMDKLGDKDTPEVAAALMQQLAHHDRGLRDAARAKLAKLENGRKALVSQLLAAGTQDEGWQLARLVAPFANTLVAKLRTEVAAKAYKFLDADDHRSDPLFFLLREADPAALRDELLEKAVAKRKKKDYDGALAYLKLLARDPSVGFAVRLELATVGLKLSAKNVAADARNTDHSLRNFATALSQNADETLKQVSKAKWLDADDLFYLGFHFAEQFGREREFGVAVLKHLVKQSPKSKAATNAKNKLKSIGVK